MNNSDPIPRAGENLRTSWLCWQTALLGITAALIAVVGCSTSKAPQRRAKNEQPSLQINRVLLTNYSAKVGALAQILYDCLPEQHAAVLPEFVAWIDGLNQEKFGFYTDTNYQPPRVTFGLNSLVALDKACAAAAAVPQVQSTNAMFWARDFLLLLRAMPDWSDVPDPYALLQLTPEQIEACKPDQQMFFSFVTLFILAHEIGHLALRHSASHSIEQEKTADQFAIQLLCTEKMFTQPIGGPSGAPFYMNMLLLLQGTRSEAQSSHPATIERFAGFVNYIMDNEQSFRGPTNSVAQFLAATRSLRAKVASFNPELDDKLTVKAKSLTVEVLRRENYFK